jgi:hypothetical protein
VVLLPQHGVERALALVRRLVGKRGRLAGLRRDVRLDALAVELGELGLLRLILDDDPARALQI